jgi:hypothetical protein
MNHFDAVEYDPGARYRLEAEHRADPAFAAPMVLFYPVVEVLALAYAIWSR